MKIRKQQEPSEEPQYQPNRAERRRWLNDVKRQMRRAQRKVNPLLAREAVSEAQASSILEFRLD